MYFSKHARWFCCGYLGTPFEKQGTCVWHQPIYLGGTHLLSEHSLDSYTMPGTVPGAVGAGRVPEQQAPRWQASEEAAEMGCRDTGDGGLGSGCPRVLFGEAPCRRARRASGNIHLSDQPFGSLQQPASLRLAFESSNSNLTLLRSSHLAGPPQAPGAFP